jgi:hypothetical protein
MKDLLANTWTPDKEPLVRAYQKEAARLNEQARKVTGMDTMPERFDLEAWTPIIRKVVILIVTVLGSYAAGSVEDAVKGDLRATEGTIGTVVRTEDALRDETKNLDDAIQFYVAREVACDLALVAFSRHRDDERDWEMVVEQCHSQGVLEPEP